MMNLSLEKLSTIRSAHLDEKSPTAIKTSCSSNGCEVGKNAIDLEHQITREELFLIMNKMG